MSHQRGITPKTDQILFFLFLCLLLWLPLPLGSNRPWAWGVMEVWGFLLLLVWIALYLRGKAELSGAFVKARPLAPLFLLWLLLPLLQLVPLPVEWVGWISERSARMYDLVGFGVPRERIPISVDPFATEQFLLKGLFYLTVFGLTLLLVRDSQRVRVTILVLVLGGVFQAAWGGMVALQSGEVARGTFANRNHLAGYLELCIGLGLGLLMADLSDKAAITWRQRARDFAKWAMSPKIRLRIFLAIMVVGLVLTRSRMGNTAFFTSMLVTGAIWLVALRRRPKRSSLILLVSILILDIYILGNWFGLEEVVERLRETSTEGESRDEVFRDTIHYVQNYPLLGSGGGTFYSNYPQFRGADVSSALTLRYAHNDYLQVAAETGMVGLGLMGMVMLLSLGAALRAMFIRRDPLMRGVGFGAFMGMTSILIHSTVDFNLQIAANAGLFMVVVAMGWIALGHARRASETTPSQSIPAESKKRRRRSRPRFSRVDWKAAAFDDSELKARKGFSEFVSLAGGQRSEGDEER